MTREEELKLEGWEKMSTLDEPRLSEAVEEYKEIGFEVRLEPFIADEGDSCSECILECSDKLKTIYIRKRS